MTRIELIERELTHSIIGAFYDSYYKLGFGFLEAVYTAGLCRELRRRGLSIERESQVAILYDGEPIAQYRCDVLVQRRVILEVKSTETLPVYAKRQLMNYLRATDLEVGLLLHYGPEAKFHRVVNTYRGRRVASAGGEAAR